jgi:hypothetical protein
MDHNEAVQLQAAVKYVLGELSPVQRDDYEEHYFDCAECALDIKALATFADTTREVLRQEKANQLAKDFLPARGGWLRWLQPIVAVPAMVGLLIMLGYQSFVSVPHWKALATQSAAPRVLPMFSLITANTRSSDSLAFRVPQGEPFGVYIDVPTDASYQAYLLRLVDPKGQSTILRTLSYEEAQKTQVVEVNPGQSPGAYQIVVLGLTNKDSDPGKAAILATMKFSVEFGK